MNCLWFLYYRYMFYCVICKYMKKYSIVLSFSLCLLFLGLLSPKAYAATPQVGANNWWLTWVTYVSRATWWADETWRYASRSEYASAQQQFSGTEDDNTKPATGVNKTKIATEYVLKLFASYFHIDTVTKKEDNKALWWSLQYTSDKQKILIHHTATNGTLPKTEDDEKQFMKDLYKYHAFVRKRWDIGYNFIVMPSWRVYEWRKWGAWVVGAHATWNNTSSVGISVVGNFETILPTQAQVDSVVVLTTAVAKKYGIKPLHKTYYFKSTDTFPYIVAMQNYAIAGHRDAGYTKCPGTYLYTLLDPIRKETANRLAGKTAQSVVVATYESLLVAPVSTTANSWSLQSLREAYIATTWFTASKASIARMASAPSLEQIPTLKNTDVRVMLYDASTSRDSRVVLCTTTCSIRTTTKSIKADALTIAKTKKWFSLLVWNKTYSSQTITVTSVTSWGSVRISDYGRVGANKIALNVFRNTLMFVNAPMKTLDGKTITSQQIINILPLDSYLKGIAEASDTEPQTKTDVLALLTKGYALYYLWWKMKHPSVPDGALYNAIDDPRLFQKYVGQWWESISKNWPIALANTKDKYVVYNSQLPILPYFHCSAGFTWSAKEKRWWTDTPYLQSVKDVAACGDFEWHGVGLSWKWATALAQQGKSAQDIIQYYYPGTTIQVIKN